MPPKFFSSCPEYQKIMTSSWEHSTPYLVTWLDSSPFNKHNEDLFINKPFPIILPLCLPGVLSILGNGILLFVAYRKKSSLKPAEFFVVNLAISDLSMTITLFPLAIPSAYAHMWVTFEVLTRDLFQYVKSGWS